MNKEIIDGQKEWKEEKEAIRTKNKQKEEDEDDDDEGIAVILGI